MKLLLTGIILFLVIMYIYTYIRYKKRKKQNVHLVDEFRRKYVQKKPEVLKQGVDDQFIKYTTKFNSTVDYIERDEFLKESQEMKEPVPKRTPKQLQF